MEAKILIGDVRKRLVSIESGSVRTCITSPPYFGLRDYGNDGQIGLEQTPEDYVAQLVEVFRGVRRVLADDGTLWLNLGTVILPEQKQTTSSRKTLSASHGEWRSHFSKTVGISVKTSFGQSQIPCQSQPKTDL